MLEQINEKLGKVPSAYECLILPLINHTMKTGRVKTGVYILAIFPPLEGGGKRHFLEFGEEFFFSRGK